VARLLYLHVPFCEKLCPYCSFNRVVFQERLCREYFRALRREILLYKERGFTFHSVYIGGGTPTVLIDELEETLCCASACFPLREISVETNPNHLTANTVAALQRAGVKRLSIGIQSFDDQLLKDMDRYEKYGSGEDTAERLRHVLGKFETVNADMIFNFPSQSRSILEKDLETLTATGVDQITYYPLMVSDVTRETVTRTLGTVDYRREEEFYHRIVACLAPAYRFSSAWCFSKKAVSIDEYIIGYDEYAGLGSGSIGYVNGMCYANTFDIREYIACLDRGELPLMSCRYFSAKDRLRYDFLMKLFGLQLNVNDLRKKYGFSVSPHLWLLLAAFSLSGGLRWSLPHVFLTRRGRYQWVIMMREFFAAVNNFRDFCRANIKDMEIRGV
jgi:menaquinone C8-methyltransferase